MRSTALLPLAVAAAGLLSAAVLTGCADGSSATPLADGSWEVRVVATDGQRALRLDPGSLRPEGFATGESDDVLVAPVATSASLRMPWPQELRPVSWEDLAAAVDASTESFLATITVDSGAIVALAQVSPG